MTDESEIDVHPVCDRCWTEERPKLLNASTRSCEFGAHDFLTLAALVDQMRGGKGHGPDPESPLIVRGHALEDDALDEIQKLRPTWQITLNKNHYVDWKHRTAATPDAKVIDPARTGIGLLQIKIVSRPIYKKKWFDGESPPLGYLLQLTAEMMLVPHCTWGAIGVLVIGDFTFEAHVFQIERDMLAETKLRLSGIKFWQAFDRGDQPAIDFERDGALIALMFPSEVPRKVVDLTGDNRIGELLEQEAVLRETQKDVKKQLETTQNEIKAKIGDAEIALVNGWRVTFKTQHRTEHTVKATSFRVLRAVRDENERPHDNN